MPEEKVSQWQQVECPTCGSHGKEFPCERWVAEPPVPQEAAPLIVNVAPGTPDVEGLNQVLTEENGHRATAPDSAMRVVVDDTFVAAVEDRLGMGHGAWDMISAEKICRAVIEQVSALIREAGRERERALRTAQRYIKSLQRLLDEDFTPRELSNEVSEAQKDWAEASRLLGGESK